MNNPLDNPQSLAGTYQGAASTLVLSDHGMFLHSQETFSDGTVRYGIAARVGNRLALSFGPKNKMEIGVYRIQGANLIGRWVPPAARGVDLSILGREEHTGGIDGRWTITDAVSITGERYTGELQVSPPAPHNAGIVRVKMQWTLHDGVYDAFGLHGGDAIFACFNLGEGSHGVAMLDIIDGRLEGIAAFSDTEATQPLRFIPG